MGDNLAESCTGCKLIAIKMTYCRRSDEWYRICNLRGMRVDYECSKNGKCGPKRTKYIPKK